MSKQLRSINESRDCFAGVTAHVATRLWPLTLLVLWASQSWAYTASDYPTRAPVDHYMMDQTVEIALARTAAPASVSDKAEILVLAAHGYKTAVKGTNGFVCYVGRSWENDFDNAEFWNPRQRAPECVNNAAARSVLPYYLQRTEWVLSGVSRDEMTKRTNAEIAAGHITAPEVGAMCFMMSKDGFIASAGGPWHPHVMFWAPRGPGSEWGADLDGSPVLSSSSDLMPFTIYFVLVRKWSDGTLAEYAPRSQDTQ
jgi:hypothetical protein